MCSLYAVYKACNLLFFCTLKGCDRIFHMLLQTPAEVWMGEGDVVFSSKSFDSKRRECGRAGD